MLIPGWKPNEVGIQVKQALIDKGGRGSVFQDWGWESPNILVLVLTNGQQFRLTIEEKG